jgi:hypothetical protein
MTPKECRLYYQGRKEPHGPCYKRRNEPKRLCFKGRKKRLVAERCQKQKRRDKALFLERGVCDHHALMVDEAKRWRRALVRHSVM